MASQNCRTPGWRHLEGQVVQPAQKAELQRSLHLDLQQEEGAKLLWDTLKKACLFSHHVLKSLVQWQTALLDQNSSAAYLKSCKASWESRQCFHWLGEHQDWCDRVVTKPVGFTSGCCFSSHFPAAAKQAPSLQTCSSGCLHLFCVLNPDYHLPSPGIPGDVMTIPVELSPPVSSMAKQSFAG